jgi:hypothetical protein
MMDQEERIELITTSYKYGFISGLVVGLTVGTLIGIVIYKLIVI